MGPRDKPGGDDTVKSDAMSIRRQNVSRTPRYADRPASP